MQTSLVLTGRRWAWYLVPMNASSAGLSTIIPIYMLTLVAFVAVDVGFSIWSTTTTSSLFKIIPNGRAGSVLGVNSAITGAGLLIGSIAAGEAAATLGYGMTFALVSKYFRQVVVKVTA